MFHLLSLFVFLSQKSSQFFQLAGERPESFCPSPSDILSTRFKSDNLSLCSCEKLFALTLTPVSPALAASDSVSPPLFPPLSLKIASLSTTQRSLCGRTSSSPCFTAFIQEGCRRLRLTLHNQGQAAQTTEQHRDKVRTDCSQDQ